MRHPTRTALTLLFSIAAAGSAIANEPSMRGTTAQGQPVTADLTPMQAALAARLARLPTTGGAKERADRQALQSFYAARGNSPVWTGDSGATPRALALMAELAKADDWGLSTAQLGVREIEALIGGSEPSQMADVEVGLSMAALTYARHARGGRVEPGLISENIDRKPYLKDPKSVIEEVSAAGDPAAYLRGLQPRHAEFERLRQLALSLKSALAAPATHAEEPSPPQGRKSRRPAERPEAAQLRKVQASMEQWRWMPEDLGNLHVAVNIPEFTMRVIKDGRVMHSERVIVGKTETPTPVFSNAMQTVVFQPNWYVPPSIKDEEIWPALERGSNILQRRGLRVQRGGKDVDASRIDWASADPRQFVVYQPSGAANALGQVKFLFPNRHDVYMHDTPSKGLFNSTVRTFSHGCVRVRNPLKFAELVMREDKAWDAPQIDALVRGPQQNNAIALERKIPVHITYFTASVEADGTAVFSADVYGHDARIVSALQGQVLIAEARSRSKQTARTSKTRQEMAAVKPPSPSYASPRSSDRNWMRNVLNNQY